MKTAEGDRIAAPPFKYGRRDARATFYCRDKRAHGVGLHVRHVAQADQPAFGAPGMFDRRAPAILPCRDRRRRTRALRSPGRPAARRPCRRRDAQRPARAAARPAYSWRWRRRPCHPSSPPAFAAVCFVRRTGRIAAPSGCQQDPYERHPAQALAKSNGSLRKRLPVSLNRALAKAGASGGRPGSPMPVGGSFDGTMCTSMRHVGHARHRVVAEVLLLDHAVLQRDGGARQGGAEAHQRRALDLRFDGQRIDRPGCSARPP
jgi:hypothetical protein